MPTDKKEMVREYQRAKRERDRAAFEELFHDDFSTTFVRYHGGEELFDAESLYERTGASTYTAGLSDRWAEYHELVAEDDVAILRLHYGGTHTGPWQDAHESVEATGKEICVQQHLTFEFEAGKIIDMHSTADLLGGVWRRIGADLPELDAEQLYATHRTCPLLGE